MKNCIKGAWLLLIACGAVTANPLPESGTARYWVQQGGEWLGYETLEWSYPEADTYRLVRTREERHRPAVRGGEVGDRRIQRTREISEGTLDGDIAQPTTYEVRTATVFLAPADYDPETAFEGVEEETRLRVRFTDNPAELAADEIAIPPNVLDPVSHRWQVMQQALNGQRHQEIAHEVVGEDGEVEQIVFRIEGRQTVRTRAGTFRTVRLTRKLAADQRAVRWYLAEGWAGLPVRTVDSRSEHRAQRTRLEHIEATPANQEG